MSCGTPLTGKWGVDDRVMHAKGAVVVGTGEPECPET